MCGSSAAPVMHHLRAYFLPITPPAQTDLKIIFRWSYEHHTKVSGLTDMTKSTNISPVRFIRLSNMGWYLLTFLCTVYCKVLPKVFHLKRIFMSFLI